MSAGTQPRAKKGLLRRWLTGIGIAMLLLALLFTIALFSNAVFRMVAATVRPLVPDELHYESVSGTLAGPVTMTNVDYTVAGTRISAEMLTFDVSPLALFGATVDVRDVQARGLAVMLAPSGEPDTDAPPRAPRDVFDALHLPVDIRAHGVRVDGFTLHDGSGGVLLELRGFSASLDWSDERIAVNDLDASGPAIDVTGDISLALDASNETSIALDGHWRGLTFPLAGRVTATGSAQRMDLAVTLHEPARALLNARLQNLLDAPQWQGTLSVHELLPSSFDATLPATPWSGEFRFAGDWQDTTVQATAHGGWPPADGIDLALDATVNAKRLKVTALEAGVAAFDARANLHGELHYAEALRYSVGGSIERFVPPGMDVFAIRDANVDVVGDARSLQLNMNAAAGTATNAALDITGGLEFATRLFDARIDGRDLVFDIEGTQLAVPVLHVDATGLPEAYQARTRARMQLNTLPAADLKAQVRGDSGHAVATLEHLQWLDGNAHGELAVNWKDALRMEARLDAKGFGFERLDARLAGEAGGSVFATADFAGEQPQVSLRIESLAGNISGERIEGGGALRLADGRLSSTGLSITAGDAALLLDDRAGAGFGFRLDAPQLGMLHPDLDGALTASGHFDGNLAAPALTVVANGSGISWQGHDAGTFDLDMAIAAGGRRDSFLRLDAADIETPWLRATLLHAELLGTRAEHRVQLDVAGAGSGSNGELHFAAAGGLENSGWRGAIAQLDFEHPATGRWQLTESGADNLALLGKDTLRIPEHCLQGTTGRVCAGPLHRDANGWQAAAELDDLPVGIAAAWLPDGLDYSGVIDGHMQLGSAAGALHGSAGFQLARGAISQKEGDAVETLLGWESGQAAVDFNGRVARASLAVDLEDGGRITGEGRLDVPRDGPMRIDAGVHADLDDLQLVPSLIPELDRLEGRVTADLDIDGPLDAPRIRGKANLHDGRARILALGTDWENVNLAMTAEGRELALTGHAESGDGHIDIDLEGRDSGDGFNGNARLTGENFRAIDTPEASVVISPQLDMRLENRDLYIDGEVSVPFARIEPRDLSTAVQPSEDQVIVNADDGAAEGLRAHVAVTTTLGDNVRVNALGLTARLEGQLTVAQQPDSPATGNGRLSVVEGKYKSYGQDLTLARGEIIYTGQPLSNPGLDIRAERRIEPDITVGVAVRGPLSLPTANVYSDPAMTETEALSYLLFGRSIDQATSDQEGQINSAALALNLGGRKLLGTVGRKLGVEEVRVDTGGEGDEASLVLGKYLSPDLYVSYGIGLYESVNTFRIRYRMSSKWTLEATSGLKNSADFVYTIER